MPSCRTYIINGSTECLRPSDITRLALLWGLWGGRLSDRLLEMAEIPNLDILNTFVAGEVIGDVGNCFKHTQYLEARGTDCLLSYCTYSPDIVS